MELVLDQKPGRTGKCSCSKLKSPAARQIGQDLSAAHCGKREQIQKLCSRTKSWEILFSQDASMRALEAQGKNCAGTLTVVNK